ncbi:MAG: NADP-dependent oxidoreductase, partial [Pseudomonadota bacterium]|nr:NADP-dependent oxidoreductase [Pseudomonadota bacterium]
MAQQSEAPTTANTALAVLYSGRGGPDVMRAGERHVRAARPGEVRIRVRAATVNPTDILLRDPGFDGVPAPMTPGMDAAGVIESVGLGVTRVAPGDEVMAAVPPMRAEGGAQASLIVVPADNVVAKPRNASFAEAATVPMNGLTALYAMDKADLSPGQTLAITGGSGWLAYLTTVFAKKRGLRVVTQGRPSEIATLRARGADIVIDRAANFAEAVRASIPHGVDALLDTALLGEAAFGAIADSGIYIPVRGRAELPEQDRVMVRPVLVNEVLHRTDWLEAVRRAV